MEENVQGEKAGLWSRISWQAKLAFTAVIIYCIIAFSLYARLKHLPGPYYGGDLYAHYGFALNYIANGFWTDPYFVGHYAFYPWLGNYLFIALSLLPGITLMQAENFVPIIMIALSALAFWFLGIQVFKNKTLALALVLVAIAFKGFPGGAPNNLPWMITIPFWFAFWLKAEETGKLRDKALAGLFMGLTSLSHVAFFLSGLSIFIFTILVETLLKPQKKQALLNAFSLYGPMILVGLVVSMPFYGPIIVKYHAKTLNPLFQYNGPDISALGIPWLAGEIWRSMINFRSIALGALSVLTVLGFIACMLNFRKKLPRYALLWFAAGALVPMHHLITRPLLDRWVLPGHLFGAGLATLLFAVFGIGTIQKLISQRWPDRNSQKIIIAGVLVLFAAMAVLRYESYRNDHWVQFGEKLDPATQAWLSLGKWAQEKTGQNAVFLTYPETCFAMNGVSGRKCVLVRRTHANYFVDVEQRYADGVVMLYGNSKQVTDRLIDEYDVEYVLIDTMMVQQPVMVDQRFESYLAENNVSFAKVRERKDPADPNARVFDLLAVPAQSINQHLQSRLLADAEFKVNDQTYLQALKVQSP